ncbi:putative TRAPP complex subunit trs31 [Paratrimastix pyriformis]|uniref:Trafficking protein particle complex subunit n=1 Tax=Paratrimastix pyriformis TaxID=342808 RepID=A0ABQ8URW5_9EUKA|nr:putative TRAPP complex subunit trs31 [Paratrimastix pyriformis]
MESRLLRRPVGTILERNVATKSKAEVNLHAFSLLFGSYMEYTLRRFPDQQNIERRLDETGYRLGPRILELVSFRERANRQLKIQPMLNFISTTIWRNLFGKSASLLKFPRGTWGIRDSEPLTNKYISPNLGGAAFIGGIIRGILCAANFECTVACHQIAPEKG